MIPLFRPTFRTEECLQEMKRALEIGWTGQGFLTEEFESNWSSYTGLSNSIMLNSASAALHLALESMKIVRNWKPEDEIISSPLTFVSTNHAILWSGLVPVLADVDESLCLSVESVEKLVTPKTKGVIFVAIGGNSGRIKEIQEFCSKNGLAFIVDAAHAAGSKLNGEVLGKGADAICYSYQAVKNLPTADSGMLCLSNNEEHEVAKKLSWLGISASTFERNTGKGYKWEYNVDYLGYKDNGNSIMAAMGLVGLKYLDEDNEIRRKIASYYSELLDADQSISYISHANLKETSQHIFQVIVEDRPKVIDALTKAEIGCGVHYRTNCEYKMYAKYKPTTPNATKLSEKILTLPIFLDITRSEQELVIHQILGAK